MKRARDLEEGMQGDSREDALRSGLGRSKDEPAHSEQLQKELHNLKQLLNERTNDLQRLRADFENYRKQVEQQKASAKKIAEFSTVKKFLTLLDDLDRAVSTYDELKPLEKSLTKMLKELSLSKIDTTKGQEFNPELHEAVMAEGDGEQEIIAETLRPGYCYEGEVLRPAMVKVERR